MLKKDNIWLGVLVGMVLPAIFYLVIKGILLLVHQFSGKSAILQEETIYLLSIFINLVPIRLYFVNFKSDKTGRGILLVTFIMMVAYFAATKYL